MNVPRKIKSLREVRLDVFEALKRAYVRRGFIPIRVVKPQDSSTDKQTSSKPEKPSTSEQKDRVKTDKESDDKSSDAGSSRLIDLTQKAQEVLFQANSVFPFILFPDSVTLDREKLTIVNRLFFRMAKITSVPIADILSVEADVGPFFGSVHLTSRYFFTNVRSINFLMRGDAVKVQRLLQGYIIAHERGVDCTTIDTKNLLILLYDLGQGSSD